MTSFVGGKGQRSIHPLSPLGWAHIALTGEYWWWRMKAEKPLKPHVAIAPDIRMYFDLTVFCPAGDDHE